MRPLLGESWTLRPQDLLDPLPTWWHTTPLVMYAAHLLMAAGILAGSLSRVVARRAWRFSGLEAAALLMVCGAALSVPAASDKRLAINMAIGTILPLIGAAVLYQLLIDRATWRRALLAALLAVAAANAFKATSQRLWEFDLTWDHYQETKESFWAAKGKDLADPEVALYEARMRSRQPLGYFYHPNVLASFLLLGLAGATAAIAGFRWRRGSLQAPQDPVVRVLSAAALLALALLGAWCLVVLGWIGSAGAMVGLLAGVATGIMAWLLRGRLGWAALIGAGALVLLQAALIGLAANASRLYPALGQRPGPAKSLAVRLNYWEGAAQLFGEHPLTGVGPGQFGKAYLRHKPIWAAEEVANPHNWLLNQAAEWGLPGALGLIVALGGTGWVILRSLAVRPAPEERSPGDALLPAVLLVLACWLGVLLTLGPADWLVRIAISRHALACSLIVAALASLSPLAGGPGLAVLLAGLVAFVVHGTVEMAPAVPAAAWPFWAAVALAMAWMGSAAPPAAERRWVRPALLLPGAVMLAVLVLTVRPLGAILRVGEARAALAGADPAAALEALRAAARRDPLDPAPPAAAAIVAQQMAARDLQRRDAYLKESAWLYHAAVQRDPRDNVLWRDLAMGAGTLARATGDFLAAERGVSAMDEALELYPNWPRGWLEYAQLLAQAGALRPDGSVFLRRAVEALGRALALDAGWPPEDPRKFTVAQRERLAALRAEWLHKIRAQEPRS